MKTPGTRHMTLFLCGDVMTGRGIDQVLPHPGDPTLHELWVKNARRYVELAEAVSGPIQRPVSYSYIWGDALEELRKEDPHVRIANLETSVTTSDRWWKGKQVHYRMHPENTPCLSAARIDVCTLANNHVLDWGRAGLLETLDSLRRAEIRTAGAGTDLREAAAPATIEVAEKGRVIVFSYGMRSSGIPSAWAASEGRPGIHLLTDSVEKNVRMIEEQVAAVKQTGDVVVASIHWGSNWGYAVPREQTALGHALIDDAGVDLILGHSSHHVKGMELRRGRLILYGAGDFLNDYEGIGAHEDFRGDLVMMYFATLDPATGTLVRLRMRPMRIRRFRARRASEDDVRWLEDVLVRECRRFGTHIEVERDGTFVLTTSGD